MKRYFSTTSLFLLHVQYLEAERAKFLMKFLFLSFFNLVKPSVPSYQPLRITVLYCFCSKAALFIIFCLLPSKVPTKGFNKHNMHKFKHNV